MTDLSEDRFPGYTIPLESWEYEFWKDHLERNENMLEEDEENDEFVASYTGNKEIFWYGVNDGTSAWLRTFTLESEELESPVQYLESVNEKRIPRIEERSREEYGLN